MICKRLRKMGAKFTSLGFMQPISESITKRPSSPKHALKSSSDFSWQDPVDIDLVLVLLELKESDSTPL